MTQIYKISTATVTNGSTAVAGDDTGWVTALVTGGLFTKDGLSVPIESVGGEDELTLALPWPGDTGTGAYAIMRENSAAASVVDMFDRMSRALITLSLHSIHPSAVGTLAGRDALTLGAEETQFVFLRLETGQPDEYYRWGGADWIGPFPVRGPAGGAGPQGSAGRNFQPDEVVPLIADRDAFDDEPERFAVLVESDAGHSDQAWLYFKLSNASADWSAGSSWSTGVTDGDDAWSPRFSMPLDGSRSVLQVSWVGGTGAAPSPDGWYIGASGDYVEDIGDAATVAMGAGGREKLLANRTYYVRTDGSDSNDGLANTSGGAFLTIQKAFDVIWGTLDLSTYQVTIQIADGTYTGRVVANGPTVGVKNDPAAAAATGAPPVIIQGNNGTPANVLINTTGDAFFGSDNAAFQVRDLKIQSTAVGIHAVTGAHINFQNVNFGACTTAHIQTQFGGYVAATGAYAISAASARHIRSFNGYASINAQAITLTGTPAFSDAFIVAERMGYVTAQSTGYSGSATGSRYDINHNSVVFTNGAATTAFPGDAVGTTATGGLYA